MGLLGELFDDVVDIVAAPVKIVTKVTDEVIDSEFTEAVNAIKEEIKVDN